MNRLYLLVALGLLLTGCGTQAESQQSTEELMEGSGEKVGKLDFIPDDLPDSVETVRVSQMSLQKYYDSLTELYADTNVIAEVEITGVEKEVESEDTTYYNARVLDVLKGELSTKEIQVNQVGIMEEDEGSGEVYVLRDNPLMESKERYILFLDPHPSQKNVYSITGEYHGKFAVVNEQVHSVENPFSPEESSVSLNAFDPEKSRSVKGMAVDEFKQIIQELE
ncbi:hypothetical protein [Halalkalibacter oceani]|uniref:Lipoprotein n=1 Tax=Halalkalibacter oceani TaxID=1653776 RepID=A0A9X2IPS1_9BACI|nr:hypothetical protein [Halalkalibacter oceani]MCM3714727.1 hypothetical protein [Halalkalibacter oceani]